MLGWLASTLIYLICALLSAYVIVVLLIKSSMALIGSFGFKLVSPSKVYVLV